MATSASAATRYENNAARSHCDVQSAAARNVELGAGARMERCWPSRCWQRGACFRSAGVCAGLTQLGEAENHFRTVVARDKVTSSERFTSKAISGVTPWPSIACRREL